MADVHYFPRYTQRENFVTNNTLHPNERGIRCGDLTLLF